MTEGDFNMCHRIYYFKISLNSLHESWVPKFWPGPSKIFLGVQLAPEKFWPVCIPALYLYKLLQKISQRVSELLSGIIQ